MSRLGYERFGAQGGDWGSAVTIALGEMHRDRVHGIHVNMPTVPLGPLTDDATEQERKNLGDFEWHTRWGTGYQHQQSTRPQTLGYVARRLAGRAARMDRREVLGVDRLRRRPAHHLHPRPAARQRERLLVHGHRRVLGPPVLGERRPGVDRPTPRAMAVMAGPVTVPTGCSVFPREIRRPSRRWAEQRFTNIHWWNEPARGGHFAAFEQPELFVDEVRSSFRTLRAPSP